LHKRRVADLATQWPARGVVLGAAPLLGDEGDVAAVIAVEVEAEGLQALRKRPRIWA